MFDDKYKIGLQILELFIEPDDKESWDSFGTHSGSLRRHLDEYLMFGGSDSDINRDIFNLNRLARSLTDHNFNDLAVSRRDIEKTLFGLLKKQPSAKAHQVAARIFYNKNRISNHRISEDKAFLDELLLRYQIPLTLKTDSADHAVGPEIDWRGPDETRLQSWFRSVPDMMLDMGLLKQAVEKSGIICLLDLPALNRTGSGFLIAPGLVLTNYHVLKLSEHEDIHANAAALRLSFGYTGNDPAAPATFKLRDDQPILSQSPSHELDYALLQVEDKIGTLAELKLAPYTLEPPESHAGLYILQHPRGETMKLALNDNGITGVYPDSGRVQYVTNAAPGSSGSPCFNEDWQVVALHHAEKAKGFGTIREGILFSNIYQEIKQYLH